MPSLVVLTASRFVPNVNFGFAGSCQQLLIGLCKGRVGLGKQLAQNMELWLLPVDGLNAFALNSAYLCVCR